MDKSKIDIKKLFGSIITEMNYFIKTLVKDIKLIIILILLLIIIFTYYSQLSENQILLKFMSFDRNSNQSEDEIRLKYNSFDTKEMDFFIDSVANEEWYPSGVRGDNITGYDHYIVPNIVHYVLIDRNQIDFNHYLSLRSVFNVQKPDKVIIHCNCDQIEGKYYEKLKNDYKYEMKEKFIVRKVEKPKTVFGIHYGKNILWHSTDVIRIMALIEFGGIYLDRDMYVIKSLDEFRKYEMTLDFQPLSETLIQTLNNMDNKNTKNIESKHDSQSDLEPEKILGNMIQIAHKNARFLKLYLQTYQKYNGNQWYFNAGLFPTERIIRKYPHLVHSLNGELGTICLDIIPLLYLKNDNNWKQKYYAIHLNLRDNQIESVFSWYSLIPSDNYKRMPTLLHFDEQNIKTLNTTFGQMARLVIYNTTEFIND